MQMLRGTAHKTGAFPGQGNCNGEFGKKEMKTKHKKLRGRCAWRVFPVVGNL